VLTAQLGPILPADQIAMACNLDLQSVFELKNVRRINDLTPTGGVFSKISSTDLAGIQFDTDMVGGVQGTDFMGRMSFPANTIRIGDTYSLKLSGRMTSANGDGLRIKGLFNFSMTQTVLFDADVSLDLLVDGHWEVEVEFTFRDGTMLASGNFAQCPIDTNKSFNGVGLLDNVLSLMLQREPADVQLCSGGAHQTLLKSFHVFLKTRK
jgi:hypothetical protein